MNHQKIIELAAFELEAQIKLKIEEYNKAEQEEQPRSVLIALYREIKHLRFQLTLTHPAFRYQEVG